MLQFRHAVLAIISLGAAGVAHAAPVADMNDVTYLAVARCTGLAEGLGADAKPYAKVLDQQSTSRTGDVMDRADDARRTGRRDARDAGPDGKASYARQLDGACHSYVSAG